MPHDGHYPFASVSPSPGGDSGLAALVTGSTRGIGLGIAIAVTLPFAALTVLLMRLVLRSRKWKSATGREELLREQGVVVTPITAAAEGMIRIHGELWRAVSTHPVPEGQPVRVIKIEGLKLYVEPVETTVPAT